MNFPRATLPWWIGPIALGSMALLPAAAVAQTGAVEGTVATAASAQPLPGVVIRIVASGRGGRARRTVSDAEGKFRIPDLAGGSYELRTAARGFVDLVRPLDVRAGETLTVALLLRLSPLREELNVQPGDPELVDRLPALMAVPASLADVAPIDGDNFAALIPVLPGVIRQSDGRLSLSGGRPEQSGLQIGDASVTDPVTGNFGIELPLDAVESVTRFNSAYAAEYGRFSSGLVRIETRRSDNDWRTSVTSFMPVPRIRGGKIDGVSSFSPRVLVGGPIVRDRLFLTQSLQYEIRTVRVLSQPEPDDLQELERLSSFTRVDATLGERHDLVATFALFPRESSYVTLDTFNPRPVTPDVHERGFQIDVSERAVVGSNLLITSQFSMRRYDVEIEPQDVGTMVFTPEGRQGSFFHREDRQSRSYQWIQTVARSFEGRRGSHLIKLGADVLHSRYDGEADRSPVEIRRADTTLAELVEFPGVSRLSASGTDVAFFVQDRWRGTDRVLVDLGIRVDRDGVLERLRVSPRAGASVAVFGAGRGIVRGGVGLFALRTPLNVATFEEREPRVVTHFAEDGLSRVGPAETFEPVSTIDRSPAAVVWSLGYDHRLTSHLVARLNHIRRESRDELVVNPVSQSDRSTLVLRSDGRSSYHETELTFVYDRPKGPEAVLSYVVARAAGDFNNFDRFFGDRPTPILRENARGHFDFDVPRRLIFRGTLPLDQGRWLLAGVIEIRSGFPYSVVDENQQFVGAPNGAGRFPAVATVDLAISRLITLKGRPVRLGVRAFNLLNHFTPRDVQGNIASPSFGGFYNGIERRFGLTLQLGGSRDE